MYMTIGRIFDLTVGKYPNKEALVEPARNIRWTYTEWDEQVNKTAHALLAEGVKKGDTVSVYLYNCYEFVNVYLACSKIGAIFNPINFRLKAKEVAYILQDASSKVVVFEKAVEQTVAAIEKDFQNSSFWYIEDDKPHYAESYHEKVQAAPSTEVDIVIEETDFCSMLYTSGTTGHPKGVLHRHREIAEHSMICTYFLKYNRDSIGLSVAPLYHCGELNAGILPRIQVGGKNVILHHFDTKTVLHSIETEKITTFFAAPTMWNMMLQEDLSQYELQSMKVGIYGGAAMAPALVKECKERLFIDLVQIYGMTEMGPVVAFLVEEDQITKAGSAGTLCFSHEIRIVKPNEEGPSEPDDVLPPYEVGEIILRGPCMMAGYHNHDEATAKALYKGWYHSGDLGYLDRDGYLYVADRVDDMVISGGVNIYPREIEDFLHSHPGVLDVAVLGEPDELWGERVVAVIVKKDEYVTAADLEKFCKESDQLADYKRPRHYIFVDELPRNASGKLQKFILRESLKGAKK
ncbi:fatty acid--CoA ligase [Bacillus cytotoxicus]|uniref:fatty acid--CoA ligase n=1 Tax=Bacillus cytotoxicus TaxID=580165 RepID=UPI00086409C3|nr:fatty acid--CoA ligase [Bacillus cytotoxicus]AWC27704.1 fatty acid--CoA ligase [Bacillus cytotoxicus]AWC40919.1 fatty acid--CoA ligase [Bacillus cytotoxicus]AWC48850.1 fatty acid--CoA ligase [Bacillus cytotoxicus]AWC51771.1 fatty acid--CoA ligase [Bacillus cytotoxicus]AWC55899.1 fatty acid--CoA ligase [Bacillus cytotoxicus]